MVIRRQILQNERNGCIFVRFDCQTKFICTIAVRSNLQPTATSDGSLDIIV